RRASNACLESFVSKTQGCRPQGRSRTPVGGWSMTSPSPVVGDWYRRINGALFEVVAIDRDDSTVEGQHFDGTMEEFELESWAEQEFEEAQAPEDWTGSVDVEPEDYDSEREISAGAWSDPLMSLDRSEASGYSEWPAPRDL